MDQIKKKIDNNNLKKKIIFQKRKNDFAQFLAN